MNSGGIKKPAARYRFILQHQKDQNREKSAFHRRLRVLYGSRDRNVLNGSPVLIRLVLPYSFRILSASLFHDLRQPGKGRITGKIAILGRNFVIYQHITTRFALGRRIGQVTVFEVPGGRTKRSRHLA
jgi:hypothetical protein